MTAGKTLLWIVLFANVMTLTQLASRGWRSVIGWMGKSIFILLSTGLIYLASDIDTAGYWGFGLWLILVIFPITLTRQLSRLMLQQRFEQASSLSIILKWLHPFDGYTHLSKLVIALDKHAKEERKTAFSILDSLKTGKSSLARLARLHQFRLSQDWNSLYEYCRDLEARELITTNPQYLLFYFRALGETGRMEQLLSAFAASIPVISRSHSTVKALIQLMLYAFTGSSKELNRLLGGPLAQLPQDEKTFWKATALSVEGLKVEADALWATLNTPYYQELVQDRLQNPLRQMHSLDPGCFKLLSQMIRENQLGESVRGNSATKQSRPWVSLFFISVNLCLFFVQWFSGGTEDPEVLYQLGGLWPPAVYHGQWWRLIAANYLHHGWLHLSMNLLCLYYLGRFVEQSLGRVRFFLFYLLLGPLTMGTIYLLIYYEMSGLVFLVGASGAIMGLLGMEAALLLKLWIRHKSAIAKEQLRLVLFVVLFQTVFDLSQPEVSFSAHIVGLIWGLLLGLTVKPTIGKN